MADIRSLRRREEILVPSKFHSPAAPSRSSSYFSVGTAARVPSKAGDATVYLFHVLAGSIRTVICGGKIGSSSLQACVADVLVGPSSSSIRLHSIKEKILVDNTLYIQTLCVVRKLAIYLSPSLQVSSLSPKVLSSLLQATRSIEV